MNIIKEIERDVNAVALFKDWLGEGGEPVESWCSELRAMCCVTCPKNIAPNWWDKVKDAVAGVIRQQLEWKAQMRIGTSSDDRLHMCSACGCCLKLKVHVPTEHVKAHTSKEVLDSLPNYCWIKREINV